MKNENPETSNQNLLLNDILAIAKIAIQDNNADMMHVRTLQDIEEAFLVLAHLICDLNRVIEEEGLLPYSWQEAVSNRATNQLRRMKGR